MFGIKEPYLDVILFLGNQRYHPPPPNKKKPLCYMFYCRFGTNLSLMFYVKTKNNFYLLVNFREVQGTEDIPTMNM